MVIPMVEQTPEPPLETDEARILYIYRSQGRCGDPRLLQWARDPTTSIDVAYALLDSSADPYVRAEVLLRGSVPDWMLRRALEDEDAIVLEVAGELAEERGWEI